MDRVVICMKWGQLYGPDYVNVLHGAVRSHLGGSFRFVCLTDDAEGIDPAVECLPIPDMGLREDLWRIGAWPKISLFSEDLHGLTGRALFIDLDMVVCGDLAPFFTYGQGLMAIDEGRWNGTGPSTMSSIMAFDLGALGYLVDRLRAERDDITGRYGLEQRYLHHEVEGIGYWPDEWLVSFKRHLRRPLLIDRLLPPKQPPEGAKIVVFHGRPRPMDLIRPGGGNRDISPHYIGGSVAWMRDYWLRNGGRIAP
jgi:hypothetical protein